MDGIFIILIIAVLGPIIGSLIGVLKKPKESFMYIMLAFAAGVMLAISFLELIPESLKVSSVFIVGAGIITGSLLMFGLDKLIPHIHPELGTQEPGHRLRRAAIYLILGIFLHNFPEGMAMAAGVISDFTTVLAIALAIAIHNIPEGICTSAPYYASTGKKLEAFLLSSSTAIPIALGFLLARFLFVAIPLEIVGFIVAATAGLMIYISGDELIPLSCNKQCRHWSHGSIFALIIGILFVLLLSFI